MDNPGVWGKRQGRWLLAACVATGCGDGPVASAMSAGSENDTDEAPGASQGGSTSGASTGTSPEPGDETTDTASTGAGEPWPDPPSNNVIDVAIWPRMIEGGHTDIELAEPGVLCRRMSLDLRGRVPSATDVSTHCEGATPEEMARSLMDTPEFVQREQKLWLQHLGPDPEQVLADHVIELDDHVFALASGDIGYDEFAVRVMAHPGFAINRPLVVPEPYDATAKEVFRVFLGRYPLGGELEAMTRLFRIWRRDFVPRYDEGYGYYVRVATIDPGVCDDPLLGGNACTASLWGEVVTLDLPLGGPQLYEDIQGAVPAALDHELRKAGARVVTRPEFWDEAADHALARHLGWWKSTAAQNETDVAEVRAALAAWFENTDAHDVRDLYAMIMSSILYTRSADVPDEDDSIPVWAIGPTKAMDARQFLNSLEVVFERELGFCDIHTGEPVGRNWYWPDRLREPQPDDFYGFGYDFYFENARGLGGCLGAVPEPTQPGLGSLFTHIDLSKTLCGQGQSPRPDDYSPTDEGNDNFERVVEHQFARFLSRQPDSEESAALQDIVEQCQADEGCTPDFFADEVCGALVRSGSFLYY